MVSNRGHYQFSEGTTIVALVIATAVLVVTAVLLLVYLDVSIVDDCWSDGEERITGFRVATL
jgi:hypothetical protein